MEQAGIARYRFELFSRKFSPASGSASSGGHNQLWIRDLSYVRDRWSTKPPVRVGGMDL